MHTVNRVVLPEIQIYTTTTTTAQTHFAKNITIKKWFAYVLISRCCLQFDLKGFSLTSRDLIFEFEHHYQC